MSGARALILDGIDDHAQVPNSPTLDLTSQVTLAAWVRPTQVATQYLVKKAIQGTTVVTSSRSRAPARRSSA
jgi:hypothetical protein